MSEMETHIGRIRKVELGEKSKDDFMKDYLTAKGIGMSTYHHTIEDCFRDECRDKYILHKSGIYEVLQDLRQDSGDDINIITRNDDGTISFVNQFYNGGTCFEEMIEKALDSLG